MGNCVKRKDTVILSNTIRLQVPMQTVADDREEMLNFRVTVSHWKLKGLAKVTSNQDAYFIKAWWAAMEFETTEEIGADLKWDCEWEFAFQSSVNDLKENNLTVMVFSTRKSAAVASLHIKQWDIATGPSQQNFSLRDKKSKVVGRCSFNASVRQETILVLQPSQTQVSLSPDLSGRFSLSIKCVTEDLQETLTLPVSTTRQWTYTETDANPPSLYIPATIETLRDAALQTKVWRHKKTEEQVLIAETWLSFSHMFKQEKYTIIKRDGPGYKSFSSKRGSEIDIDDITGKMRSYTVTRSFSEKLWLCGKEVGEVTGTMILMNIPLISQLISGVNTENGFLAQSSNFLEDTTKTPKSNQRSTLPTEIQQIIAITDTLAEFFSSGEKREGTLFSSKSNDIREQINKMKDLCNLLKSSKKQSMISFVYESKGDLLQAQNAFLDIGEHLLKFADVAPYAIRPFYYEGLIHLIRRGELDLGSLSLTEEDEKQIHKKLPGCIRYRSFLRCILQSALGKMKVKGVDRKIQQYSEFICAVCYFRVPEYRKEFLQCIQEKPFDRIPEWDYKEDNESDEIQTHILPMFDWKYLFYQFLPPNSEEDAQLRTLLDDAIWKKRVAKRGIAYFRLLAEWSTHVRRLFLDRNVPWTEIPGYSLIIATFLGEMKLRNIREYPAVLPLCACSLLHNPNLLSIFVKVLFGKTNSYSIESTSEAWEILNKWFVHLYDSHRSIPISFDEGYFIEGLKVGLTCDLSLSVAKAIWFLYRNYHLLLARTKDELVLKFIFGVEIFALSLHWSQIVRQMFWSLLYYRIVSYKFVAFEFPLGQVDESLYTRALDYVNSVSSGQTDLQMPGRYAVYIPYAQKDIQRIREGYEKWLERVQMDVSNAVGKTGTFGGLGMFPFPEMTVDNVMMDNSEKGIEEEW